MKKNAQYVVVKAIPISGGEEIPVNTSIYRTHGMYYMDGGLLSEAFQRDFDELIEHETIHGWNYLSPVRTRILYEDLV